LTHTVGLAAFIPTSAELVIVATNLYISSKHGTHRHTGDTRLNGSRYRNTYTLRQSDVSSFKAKYHIVVSLGIHPDVYSALNRDSPFESENLTNTAR